MSLKLWKNKIFEMGLGAGFADMEVYWQSGKSFEAMVFEGDISKYSVSDEAGLAFRGILNGKMGYAYTEILNDQAIVRLIEDAKSNAEIMETEEAVFIYEGGPKPTELNLYNQALSEVENSKKLEFLLEAERLAKSLDDRVFKVTYDMFGDSNDLVAIANSKGLDLEEKRNTAFAYVSVVVKNEAEQKSGAKFIYGNDFSKYDPAQVAKEAVEEAISQLGATSMPSGNYPLILRNKEAANLLQCFAPNFSSENVQKNLSKLKGKLNEPIAAPIVTVTDDPHLQGGLVSRSFDGEGVATKKNDVIKDGNLQTYLYNLKTANVDGVESTGNGSKASFKSSVGISSSNFYINPGSQSQAEIMKDIEKGIYITGLQGLHSGANAISGEFSLQANGYLIEKGQITRPVSQITIAGNYFDMLFDIEAVASDLEFSLPSGSSAYGAPSLRVKEIAVSGE